MPEGRKHKVGVVDTTKYFSLFLIIGIETEKCLQKTIELMMKNGGL